MRVERIGWLGSRIEDQATFDAAVSELRAAGIELTGTPGPG